MWRMYFVAYDLSISGQEQTGHDFEIIFKNEAGTWLQYGDQRITQVNANSESRTSEGKDSIGTRQPGTYFSN